jgi:hypothetical protein
MNNQLIDIQAKAKQLRDVSYIDINTQLHLWKEIAHLRRQYERNRSVVKVPKEFLGHSNQLLMGLFKTT